MKYENYGPGALVTMIIAHAVAGADGELRECLEAYLGNRPVSELYRMVADLYRYFENSISASNDGVIDTRRVGATDVAAGRMRLFLAILQVAGKLVGYTMVQVGVDMGDPAGDESVSLLLRRERFLKSRGYMVTYVPSRAAYGWDVAATNPKTNHSVMVEGYASKEAGLEQVYRQVDAHLGEEDAGNPEAMPVEEGEDWREVFFARESKMREAGYQVGWTFRYGSSGKVIGYKVTAEHPGTGHEAESECETAAEAMGFVYRMVMNRVAAEDAGQVYDEAGTNVNWANWHTPDCGTKHRGCSPECPKAAYDRLLEAYLDRGGEE